MEVFTTFCCDLAVGWVKSNRTGTRGSTELPEFSLLWLCFIVGDWVEGEVQWKEQVVGQARHRLRNRFGDLFLMSPRVHLLWQSCNLPVLNECKDEFCIVHEGTESAFVCGTHH